MNKLQEHFDEIIEGRKAHVPFDSCLEIPLGITALKDDGSVKCRIESADNNGITTTSSVYPHIEYKVLYKDWLFELQPGNIRIAGKPNDSGIIIP